MKKFYMAGLLLLAVVSGQAQTLDGVILASENNYYGTARSIAMGNAVSAVGGDLGSIGINPAGSAVAGYSQVTLTPGLTIATNSTDFTSPYPELKSYPAERVSRMNPKMPNVGVVYNYNVFRPGGLNSVSFGFVANSTNHFSEDFLSYGENSSTSQAGAFAMLANEIDHSFFDNQSAGMWDIQTAYDAYLIDYFKDFPDHYIGATQNKVWNDQTKMWEGQLQGTLGQTYNRIRTGYKTDILMNFGMNWNDKLYLGVNLGLPILEYKDDFTYCEEALRGEFETGFRNSEYNEYTRYSGAGIYGKFGVIWRPIAGLRLAAAFQTPTYYDINENYGWYTDVSASKITDNKPQENDGNFNYIMYTAPIYSLGAAYTFGNLGLLSFDWERTDYHSARFGYTNTGYVSEIRAINRDIARNGSFSEQYRVGAEVKVLPQVAFRAGFNLLRFAQENYEGGIDNSFRKNYSGGVGYSSDGSFFADFAVRVCQLADYYNYPYDVYNNTYDVLLYESPEYHARRQRLDVVLTLGWRF